MSESDRPVSAPARRPRKRRRWPLLLLAFSLAGGAFGAWRVTHRHHKKVDPALVVTAKRQKLDIEVTDVGRIEAPDTVQIGSRVPGRVTEVLVKEGQHVKRGELLVKFDRRTAFAEVARARAQLERVGLAQAHADVIADRRND